MKKLLSTLERLRPPTPVASCPPTPTDAQPEPPRTPDRESQEELTPQSPFTQQQSSLRPVPFREHSASSVITLSSLSKTPSSAGTPTKPPSVKRRSIPRAQFPPPPTQLEILSYRYYHGVDLDDVFTLKRSSCGEVFRGSGKTAREFDAVHSYVETHGIAEARLKLERHWKERISEKHWEFLTDDAGVTTVRVAIHWPSIGPAWCEGTPFEPAFVSTARRHEVGVILNIQHPPVPQHRVLGDAHHNAPAIPFWTYPEYRMLFANLIYFICQQTVSCSIMSQAVVGLQFLHDFQGELLESRGQGMDFHEWYDHIMHIIYSINPEIAIYTPSSLHSQLAPRPHAALPINSNHNSHEEKLYSLPAIAKNPLLLLVKKEHSRCTGYRIEPCLIHHHNGSEMANGATTKSPNPPFGYFWDYNPDHLPHSSDTNTDRALIPAPPIHLALPIGTITHLRTHALSKKISSRQSAAAAYKRAVYSSKTKRQSIEYEPPMTTRNSPPEGDNNHGHHEIQNPSHRGARPLLPAEVLTEAYMDGWDVGFTDALAFWGGDCVAGNCGGGDRIGRLDHWVRRRVHGNCGMGGNGFCYAEALLKEMEAHLDTLRLEDTEKEKERFKGGEKSYARIRAYEKGVRDGICDFEFAVGVSERNSWGGKGGNSRRGSK